MWLGIVLVIMAEAGLITPPAGMNLFVLQGIGRDVKLRTSAFGALPFLGAMLATVVLLCLLPDIALAAAGADAMTRRHPRVDLAGNILLMRQVSKR